MMMTLDLEKYCKYHIDLEFSFHNIKEVMHHVDNLELWTSSLCKKIISNTEHYKENVPSEDIFKVDGDESTFYDVCNIRLMCYKLDAKEQSEDKEPGVIGAYKVEESGRNERGEYEITINLNFMDSFDNIKKEIYVLISHELTHAYEDYCKHPNTSIQDKKFMSSNKTIDGSKITNILMTPDANPFSIELAKMLYYTSNSERQAIVNQSFLEIFKNRFALVNYKSVNDLLKSSSLYKKMEEYGKFIEKIQHLDPVSEKACLAVYNDLCYTNLTDYQKMLSKLTYRYTDFRNKLISKVSPILQHAWSLRHTFNSKDFDVFDPKNINF